MLRSKYRESIPNLAVLLWHSFGWPVLPCSAAHAAQAP